MDFGEQTTGTKDEQYNLISVLYHALHGAETAETYTLDAEAAGDERLAAFFREAQAAQRQLAERAKGRLGILEVPPEAEVAPDIPPEGGITPGEMAGGMPPGPAEVRREPGVSGEEVGGPAGEAPPTVDEGVVREPGDVREETSSEHSPREAPPAGPAEDAEAADVPPDVPPPHIPVASPPEEASTEPGRAPEQQTDRRAEGEQEEKEKKGLIDRAIDKAADKLMGQ